MPGNLYQVDSIALLDSEVLKLLKHWGDDLNQNKAPAVSHEALVEAFQNRKKLALMLRFTRDDLKNYDPALFPFLLPHQKELLQQRLIRAHYLYTLQARIDEIEYRLDGLKYDRSALTYYEEQLKILQVKPNPDPALHHQQLIQASEKPLAYFGMRVLAPVFADMMMNICAGKTSDIKIFFIEVDRKDVYLGWSRTFILSAFNLVPEAFQQESSFQTSLQNAGTYISYLNMIVVNMCLAIELILLIKNTFIGALATRKEQLSVSIWEQFVTQLNQRKFVLLNWFFLSLMHVVAFLCLSGVIQVWPWGPFFSVGCRMVQLTLMAARYDAELTQFKTNELRMTQQLELLTEKLQKLQAEYQASLDNEKKAQLLAAIRQLQLEITSIQRIKRKITVEWNLKQIEFTQQSIFTSCFFAGVMLFSCLIFPASIIAPPVALCLGVAGAAICITSIIVMSVIRANQAIEKTRDEILSVHVGKTGKMSSADHELAEYMKQFKGLLNAPSTQETELELKQLYLLMNQVVSRSITQTHLLQRQRVELWTNLARDVLLPIAGLAALIFLPTGIGLGIIAAILVISFFTKNLIEHFTPIPQYSLKFDEKSFNNFKNQPSVNKLNQFYKQINPAFFTKDHKPEAIDEDYLPDNDFDMGAPST